MELRELQIDEEQDIFGVGAISLVGLPAIEENFVFFSAQSPSGVVLAKVDEERRTIVGPALIPNKHIYRRDKSGHEFNVYFTPKTVQRAAHLFLRNSRTHSATVEHQSPIQGVYVQESWIVEEPKTDKQQVYGFDLPSGTWMVSMKVENEEMWQGIKSGELRGLSIEGHFVDRIVEANPTEMNLIQKFKQHLSAKQELYAEAKIQGGGMLVTEGEMTVGAVVAVMGEDGEIIEAEAGNYTLEDGTTVVVGEGSVIESLGEAQAEEEEMKEEFSDAQLAKIGEVVASALKAAGISDLKTEMAAQKEQLEKANTELATAKAKLEEFSKAPAAPAHKTPETKKPKTATSIREVAKLQRS